MANNDRILFCLVILYFLFYLVRFYVKNWNRKKIENFLNSLIDKLKEIYSSEWDLIKNKLLSAKVVKKILGVMLGVIILIALLCLYLVRLILKYPISFFNKILDVEKENGFELLKYIIFPIFSAFCFVKYLKSVKIHSKVLELIIKFYDEILIQLSNNMLLIFLIIVLFLIPHLLKFFVRKESPIIKEIAIYFSKWIQIVTIILLFILIVGTYVLLLDDLNNNQVDSYTIIPLFIAGCMICSNIIIKLLATIHDGETE